MKNEVFTVVYDGEALSEHTMDVRDLAPSLLSLSQIFEEANSLIYGDKAQVRLHVKALEPGCFSVDLALIQPVLSQITDLLTSDPIDALLNLKEIIIGTAGGVGGLLFLIQKFKGKSPENVSNLGEGRLRVEIDNTTFDIPQELLTVYQDISIRRSVEKVVSPLSKGGIETLTFKDSGGDIGTISESDAQYFSLPELPAEELLRERRKAAFSIVALAFREENKWRLHDGNNTIFATIKDEDFLRKVEQNEVAFRKSDVLICEVEDVSTQNESGLQTEHIVIKVLEHKPAMRQIPLIKKGETDE